MEPELAAPSQSSRPYIFFNDRGLRAGWRLAMFVGMLFAAYGLSALVLRSLRAGASPPRNGPIESSLLLPLFQGIGELMVFLLVMFFTWIMSRIERRKIGAYGLPLKKPALSSFVTGCVLWGLLPLSVLLVVLRGLHAFYFGKVGLHGAQVLSWGLLWGFCFLMVGFLEEYLFRGYVLYTLADGIGFWPAAIVLAATFGYVHMGNGGETRIGIVGVFLFGMFAAATVCRTGNLWLAVGAHAGWDWGQSFFYGVSDSGLQVPGHLLNPSIHGPDWLSGGSVGPEGSIVTLVLWGLMTAGILLIYRKPRAPAIVVTVAAGQPARLDP